jgi:hypothetical protein
MSFLGTAISNLNKIKDEFINELPNRVSKASHFNKKFHAMPEERAGREAEYLARKQIMNKIKNTGWVIHSTVRVPDWKKHHRREIDFILQAPRKLS